MVKVGVLMKLFQLLLQKSEKDLNNELRQQVQSNKYEHDMAVAMGSLGVSPYHMNLFTNSMKKMKENKNV
jgi:hypothetical protein